jgi:hypothetical protein
MTKATKLHIHSLVEMAIVCGDSLEEVISGIREEWERGEKDERIQRAKEWTKQAEEKGKSMSVDECF